MNHAEEHLNFKRRMPFLQLTSSSCMLDQRSTTGSPSSCPTSLQHTAYCFVKSLVRSRFSLAAASSPINCYPREELKNR